jgi:hypothetical protein
LGGIGHVETSVEAYRFGCTLCGVSASCVPDVRSERNLG